MGNKLIYLAGLLMLTQILIAQNISINADGSAPDGSAMLDVSDTTRGFLPPRLTTSQMNAVVSPANGLMIYNTDSSAYFFYNGGFWTSIMTSSVQADSAAVPIGTILPFGADSSMVPNGFLLCDGDALSTTIYSDLFSVIGYSWGGSGGTFYLPDLRGRFIRGTDYGAGNDPDASSRSAINTGGNTGDNVGSYQNDDFESHQHSLDKSFNNPNSRSTGSGNLVWESTGFTDYTAFEGGNETRPINANINYIICFSSKIAASSGSGNFQGSIAGGQITGNINLSNLPNSVIDSTRLTDSDNDTKIQVEESTNENIIRFDVNGSEVLRIHDNSRLNVTNTNSGVYIGSQAGSNISSGTQNSFLGYEAGASNSSGGNNTFLGYRAGYVNSTTSNNTFIGALSGDANNSGVDNTFMGVQSGTAVNSGSHNTIIGKDAGRILTSGDNNTFLGIEAGEILSTSSSGNVFLGAYAGSGLSSANNLLFIENSNSSTPLIYGDFANDSLKVYGTLSIGDSFFFPTTRGTNGQVLQTDGSGQLTWGSASDNLGDHTASSNIQLNGNRISNDGDNEGISIANDGQVTITPATTGAGNVALITNGDFRTSGNGTGYYFTGTQIGITGNNSNSGDMRFKTANTDRMIITSGGQVGVNTTSVPGGYIMHINGLTRINNLNINNTYTLPNVDGNLNEVLQTDGSGNVSWAAFSATRADTSGLLLDADEDTKITLDNSDDDIIRFAQKGTEFFRMDSGRFEVVNTGSSVYIGQNAGLNDDYSVTLGNTAIGVNALTASTLGASNTAIGLRALQANTASSSTSVGAWSFYQNTGQQNVGLGASAGFSNLTGTNNVFLGWQAGQGNTGSSNVFIGSQAGATETGSNLLYIDNSNNTTPLIYGDFAADSLRFNGIVEISSNLYLPSGNLGIGTTTPDNLLSIYNASSGAYFDLKGVGDANNFVGFSLASDEATDKSWTFLHRKVSGELNNFAFEYFDGSTYSQKLVIEPGGFVGIGDGNIDPTSRLDVEGSIEIDGSSSGSPGDDAFYFGNPDTDGSWRIKRDGNDLSFERRESGVWVFKVKINP